MTVFPEIIPGHRLFSPRKSIHQFLKPLLGKLGNRHSIANQQDIEVQSKKSTHTLAQARQIVQNLFR